MDTTPEEICQEFRASIVSDEFVNLLAGTNETEDVARDPLDFLRVIAQEPILLAQPHVLFCEHSHLHAHRLDPLGPMQDIKNAAGPQQGHAEQDQR